MKILAYILLSGALGVAGQIILKRALTALGPLALSPTTVVPVALSLALNPFVVLGIAVTLSGTFFWLIALSRVDLSYAYPFASLNYVMVLIASWWLLGETISLSRLLGVLAICAGVWAISRTPTRTSQQPAARTPVAAPATVAGSVGGPER